MLDIQLDFNKEIHVFVSNAYVTVNRIGDVILLEKDTEEFSVRRPWEKMLTANTYSLLSGNRIRNNNMTSASALELHSDKYSLSDVVNLTYKKEFWMCLLQENIMYLCKYCKVFGSKVADKYLSLEIFIKQYEIVDGK